MQWIKILGLSMILIMLVSIAGALSQVAMKPTIAKVTNFEECVAAGNVILESYPRQCKGPDGTMYVEKVASESPHMAVTTPKCMPSGCSGQVCAEESEASNIMTTCEYRAEYACYKLLGKCERQINGHCGWTATPQLDKCLKDPPKSSQSASPALVY